MKTQEKDIKAAKKSKKKPYLRRKIFMYNLIRLSIQIWLLVQKPKKL
ncbi:hypothetical protein C095_08940 [Fusobacterium necrophorum subsp. funduliforme B35]|uniref:Uncharacterized protein n=1 Tax=Fusobacterium necrophorum subsp. funduliforme B35 TaxID=1226633 RepID=A0A0B4EVE1_9FUSO|nr:hypothetical protein C095_08940 [Fusobacterium necrophorum subsp. funduliforme B35]